LAIAASTLDQNDERRGAGRGTTMSQRPNAEVLRPFADAADRILTDVADALLEGRAPAPFPAIGTIPMPDAASAPVVYQRVVRLARQLRLLHTSIVRWAERASAA
jgi:hypothetical protein